MVPSPRSATARREARANPTRRTLFILNLPKFSSFAMMGFGQFLEVFVVNLLDLGKGDEHHGQLQSLRSPRGRIGVFD